VEIDGQRVHDLLLATPPSEFVVQAGKHWRKVIA
jgi:hypothetical protein